MRDILEMIEVNGTASMNQLPEKWATAKLGEICSKPQYGWTTKASKDGSVKLLRTTDISHGKIDWDSVPYCENIPADVTKYLVQANDILVSRAGSVGVSFLINDVPSKMEQKITQSNLLLLENEIVNFIGFYYTYCYYIDRQVVKYMVTYQVEQNGIK